MSFNTANANHLGQSMFISGQISLAGCSSLMRNAISSYIHANSNDNASLYEHTIAPTRVIAIVSRHIHLIMQMHTLKDKLNSTKQTWLCLHVFICLLDSPFVVDMIKLSFALYSGKSVAHMKQSHTLQSNSITNFNFTFNSIVPHSTSEEGNCFVHFCFSLFSQILQFELFGGSTFGQ